MTVHLTRDEVAAVGECINNIDIQTYVVHPAKAQVVAATIEVGEHGKRVHVQRTFDGSLSLTCEGLR